ncbi:hypothetical protein [Chitinophaga sp. RAB17]|uniref:hypothetical protein n=1 Tax=Chitinophaga sp. RAB17 TaxID=3233049 RepID=UPI003F92AB0B
MKKLTLFIAMLLTVQLVTAANPHTRKNSVVKKTAVSTDVHGRRSASIVVSGIYIYRDGDYETVSPLCSILATAKAYVINQNTNTYDYISCPSSSTNVVVSVGDKIELRYKPVSGGHGDPARSGYYIITQEDINNGTVELSIGFTNNQHLQK